MQFFIRAGIKLIHVSKRAPLYLCWSIRAYASIDISDIINVRGQINQCGLQLIDTAYFWK